MALPKVLSPTYELTIPSSGETVSYRPFLVKEEKILLMAMEEGSTTSMAKAMKDIISACTEDSVNVKNLAPYDIEYFFLQLRGRSIGDKVDLTLTKPKSIVCKEEEGENCAQVCKIEINIDEIGVDISKIVDDKIELTDTIGVKMNYPQIETVQKYANVGGEEMLSSNIFKMINDCIEYIWDGEEIHKAKDSTKKELTEFIESLSTDQFAKIRDYFEGMPRLRHSITWKCPKCEQTAPLLLEGLDAFFG
jgi:hypothetical protein